MITKLLAIGIGSALGGISRYMLGNLVQKLAPEASLFPWGTLAVNLLGCLVIGAVYGLIDRGMEISPLWRMFLTVGFCGGFTTFSTFIHENNILFQSHNWAVLALYASVSLLAGLLMLMAGHALTAGSLK